MAKFLAATTNLSLSTATGPDKVAYPMLKHLPLFGMDFFYTFSVFPGFCIPFLLEDIFYYSHIRWKSLSILLLPSGLFLSPFKRIIPSRLLFFLESNSILFSRQTGLCPGRSTLDQILYISQPISDGFNNFRPGSRTIRATINFSKVFDSVWHYTVFHELVSAGLPPCFAHWTLSFLSNRRACVIFRNHKSRSFRVR